MKATEITTELVKVTYSTKNNSFDSIDKVTSVKIGDRKLKLSSVLSDINDNGIASTFKLSKSNSKILDFINSNISAFVSLYPENYFCN